MINVVKIGSNVIDNPEDLKNFLQDFNSLSGSKILVHGGGKEATRLCAAMGIRTEMVCGRRVTDRDTLDIVTMVYAGLINKRIVAMLQAMGCDAVGLTGADGDAIRALRRPPVEMSAEKNGGAVSRLVDFGYVGDIDEGVSTRFISRLFDAGNVLVFCAICHDGCGTLLNCNADSVAAAVAVAASEIAPTRLTYCFEKPGVLFNIDDESSVIPVIDTESFADLKASGSVADGMLPKIENALRSVAMGVSEVRICSASALMVPGGTTIRG